MTPLIRDLGRTDLVKLIEEAREVRREVSAADDASAHKDVTEATDSSSALDGAAALNSDVDGAAAEGCCWCCKRPAIANAQGDNLSVCRGCKKVNNTLGSLIAMHLKYLTRRKKHFCFLFVKFCKIVQAFYCGERCQNEHWDEHKSYCRKMIKKRERRKAKRGDEDKGEEDGGDDQEEGGEGGFIGKLGALKFDEVD